MTISFGCPNCDSSLNAPDEYAGGKARCRKCGTKIRIPTPASNEPDPLDDDLVAALAKQSPPPASTGLPARASTQAAPANQPSGQGRFIAVIVGVSVAVLVIAVTVIVLVKHSQTKQKEAAVAQLNATLDAAIARADGHADRFDYAEALLSVEAVSDEIANRPHADAVNRRLTEELARRVQDKREYDKKIAQGHVVFEGRLIPGKERERVLAERARALAEREAQKRQEEQTRLAEKQRREEEKKRKLWSQGVDLNSAYGEFDFEKMAALFTDTVLGPLWGNDSIAKEQVKRTTYQATFGGGPTKYRAEEGEYEVYHFSVFNVDYAEGRAILMCGINFAQHLALARGTFIVISLDFPFDQVDRLRREFAEGRLRMRALFTITAVDAKGVGDFNEWRLAAADLLAIEWEPIESESSNHAASSVDPAAQDDLRSSEDMKSWISKDSSLRFRYPDDSALTVSSEDERSVAAFLKPTVPSGASLDWYVFIYIFQRMDREAMLGSEQLDQLARSLLEAYLKGWQESTNVEITQRVLSQLVAVDLAVGQAVQGTKQSQLRSTDGQEIRFVITRKWVDCRDGRMRPIVVVASYAGADEAEVFRCIRTVMDTISPVE